MEPNYIRIFAEDGEPADAANGRIKDGAINELAWSSRPFPEEAALVVWVVGDDGEFTTASQIYQYRGDAADGVREYQFKEERVHVPTEAERRRMRIAEACSKVRDEDLASLEAFVTPLAAG